MPRSLVRTSSYALFALLAVVPLACGDDEESPTDPEETVQIITLTAENTFSPAQVTIEPGTTVRWVNETETHHTITPEDASQAGAWTDRDMTEEGEEFEHIFDEAGETYEYFCQPHLAAGMTGTITVQ